jgi:hypothetical protein
MTAELRCEQVRELAPELALGIVSGEERDSALRHLTGCPMCRQLVTELSSVGEELLLLAPPQEPPPGFGSRVVGALAQPTTSSMQARVPRRWRWATAVAVAASVVSAALAGGSVLLATAEDRQLAEGYRAVLSEGNGSFFAAAPLRGSEGRVGTVFGYEGDPSWVVVTLQAGGEGGVFEARVVTTDGRYLNMGTAVLGGNEAWGRQIPVELTSVQEIRFLGSDEQAVFTATFGDANPWE